MLRATFRSYCQLGKTHIIGAGSMANVSLDALRMSCRQFLRFCKDVGLLKPAGCLDAMTANIIFAQCKNINDRTISFKVAHRIAIEHIPFH